MAIGVELKDLNWIAILVGMGINIVLGFVWFAAKSPTGKIWMKGAGLDPSFKPGTAAMVRAMIIMVVTAFVMMFVFQHNFIANRDAYRLDQAGYDLTIMDGVMGGFFTWLGFIMPVQIGAVIWENKPWSYFLVNTGYYAVALITVGIVYAAMG